MHFLAIFVSVSENHLRQKYIQSHWISFSNTKSPFQQLVIRWSMKNVPKNLSCHQVSWTKFHFTKFDHCWFLSDHFLNFSFRFIILIVWIKEIQESVFYRFIDFVFLRFLEFFDFVGFNLLEYALSQGSTRFVSLVLVERTVEDSLYDLRGKDGFVFVSDLTLCKAKKRLEEWHLPKNFFLEQRDHHFFIIKKDQNCLI